MADLIKGKSAPLTFDLKDTLLQQIDVCQRKIGIKSRSEMIRLAVENFDFVGFVPKRAEHKQISVRLPMARKRELLKLARQKKVSLGELLRAALESLSRSHVGGRRDINNNPGSTVTDKKNAKKPAAKTSKTPAGKAAPKAKQSGKAGAVSKAASSPVAKKPAAKKTPAAKKAPDKKPAAKTASDSKKAASPK